MVLSTRRGLSLVELVIASSIATAVLALLNVVFSVSFRALSLAGANETMQGEFLILREYFSRDVQQASGLVKEIKLDGTLYQTLTDETTLTESAANSLVLLLPAINAKGDVFPGVYDFIIYRMEDCHGNGACLRRRLFTTRAANGDPLIGLQKSVRVPDDRVLMRHVVLSGPYGELNIPPLFRFDPPSLALAREITLSVIAEATGLPSDRRVIPQIYTATFRLRNQ